MTKVTAKTQTSLDLTVMAFIMTLASTVATQFVAERFHYDPSLGNPWFDRFYAPWDWLVWQNQFAASGPQTFSVVNVFLLLTLGITIFSYSTLLNVRARNPQGYQDVHGTAHFATQEEIEETGLLPNPQESSAGVYVGGWMDQKKRLHYLRHNGPEHIAVRCTP